MAKWSKQTYEMVARILNKQTEVAGTRMEYRVMASDFARTFAADNPKFDADKFVKACGF